MKIYLAARYERRLEMLGYRGRLRLLGHTVTSRWIDGHTNVQLEYIAAEDIAGFAAIDLIDLREADCIIFFAEDPKIGVVCGGRHVEFGYAVALGKALVVIDHRENIFHYLPSVLYFKNWEQCCGWLEGS